MNYILVSILLILGFVFFTWSIVERTRLILSGEGSPRFDRIPERIKEVLIFTFELFKIPRFQWIRFPRVLIFWATFILLLRMVIIFGRGYSDSFNLWILGDIGGENWLGKFFYFNKDLSVVILLISVILVLFFKIFLPKEERFSLSNNILWLLGLILLISDLIYNGTVIFLNRGVEFRWFNFAGSIVNFILANASTTTIYSLNVITFWVLFIGSIIFLNLIPREHLHIFTVIVNVFFKKLDPVGKLPTIENLEERLEALEESDFIAGGNIRKFSWRDYLDWLSCGEFGYCTENCPANLTGKKLDPKRLTISLRETLLESSKKLIKGEKEGYKELVPEVIEPEVVWACTTCRACEEACPGRVGYVDKIVNIRRSLVMDKGEVPVELANALRGIETNGNPWNISAMDRANWGKDLDIPLLKEKTDAEYLFWVGCAGSYDDRLQKISRAFALILKEAKVDFAILGEEERCCGDIARRSGDEFLFQTVVKENIELLKSYNVKKIITICPHCYNTLAYEYVDFGGEFEVIHHSIFLNQLLKEGKIKIKKKIKESVVYHDSCYLGRYNGIYDPPRELLKSIGFELKEVKYFNRKRGFCCGGGGGQYFKEEEKGSDRVNYRRTEQLLETSAKNIATACPFCLCMLTDGLKAKDKEEEVNAMDIAEFLAISCEIEFKKKLK